MNTWPKLRLATAILAALVGALCLAAVGDCFVGYVLAPPNWDRISYLAEALRWSVLSLPPFALSAILALTVPAGASATWSAWTLKRSFAAGFLVLMMVFFLERVTSCRGCFVVITSAKNAGLAWIVVMAFRAS